VRYVLDASVAVASLRPHEPWHRRALLRLTGLLACDDRAIVPALFEIEVGSALARASVAPSEIGPLVEEIVAHCDVVTLGPKRAALIRRVAVRAKLRAADAVYVWLAASRGVPLATFDQEVRERAGSLCELLEV
jgi:predicted nucleic acid-binding protein